MTGDTTWQWRSSNTAIASVTSDAASVTVSARAAGNTNISVMETESGKTISVPFTATAAVPASPTPAPTPATQQAVAYHIGPTHTGNTSFGKSLTFPANPTWSVTLDGPVSYPLIAGGKVFVATGGQGAKIYALDSSTGKVAWGPINTGGAYPWAGIAYDNGKVFAVNSDCLLQAFNPSGWIPRGLPRV